MSAPNLAEAVKAMRSYQDVLKANPSNANMMAAWIHRNTDEALASDFSSNAAIAILHHFSHPLYANINNMPQEAQQWITHMQPAEGIIADEETWIDMQISGQNSTVASRIFISDHSWLTQWAVANNFPPNTPMSYIINALISQLQVCEGSGGPTGANGISHTEYDLPNTGEIP